MLNAQPKPKRIDDPKYLKKIKEQRCSHCGTCSDITRPTEPHHASIIRESGTGVKPSDHETVPLCRTCHSVVHLKSNGYIWGDDVELLSAQLRAMTKAGKTFNGFSPAVFVAKTLAENWEK